MKKGPFSVVFIVSVVFLLGWSSCQNFQPANHNEVNNWQLLVAGNKVTYPEIADQIVEKSTIYQEGYVVIVDLNSSGNTKQNNKIKRLFYGHNINAVHILKINPATRVKPSSLLAIENATVLVLMPINRKTATTLLKNSELVKTLHSAFQKGAFIATKGNEWSKLTGAIYYKQRKDAVKGNTIVRQHKGLGFIPNVVVDMMPFYHHFEKGIVKDVQAEKFVFLALGKKSMVLLGKKQAMVLGSDNAGVLAPGKPFQLHKSGEQFSLQP